MKEIEKLTSALMIESSMKKEKSKNKLIDLILSSSIGTDLEPENYIEGLKPYVLQSRILY